MEGWKVELTAGGQVLAEVKIQRGIFQGESLSPLLFVYRNDVSQPHTQKI